MFASGGEGEGRRKDEVVAESGNFIERWPTPAWQRMSGQAPVVLRTCVCVRPGVMSISPGSHQKPRRPRENPRLRPALASNQGVGS